MADEQGGQSGNQKPNPSGGGAGAGMSTDKDERSTWNTAQWEAFTNREADRRVTEALKKRETEFKVMLDDTKSSAEQKLKDYQTQLTQERARAEFHAAAIGEGVVDVKAAWAVAVQFSLIKDDKTDWKELKAAHPTLFRDTRQTSSAGKPGDTGTGPVDMSTLIRRAAGIRP
jgi:hypothetical protein